MKVYTVHCTLYTVQCTLYNSSVFLTEIKKAIAKFYDIIFFIFLLKVGFTGKCVSVSVSVSVTDLEEEE